MKQILVVDDDAFMLAVISKALSGYQVVVANDGHDALRMMTPGSRFDLLITDFVMQSMTGDELLGRATRAEFPRAMHLSDVDLHFYAARYWRAWKFEAHLREFLVDRFDEEWYRNDRTGPFLMALWRQGQRHRVEALAAQLGLPDEGLAPLLRQLTRHLR